MTQLAPLELDLDEWAELTVTRPLTLWRAWDSPRTSQRRLVQALATHKVVFGFGGNRSGKTQALRACAVALALGSDHPDAEAFWAAHGCDPRAFPRGPGNVWIVALRVQDSIEYHRRQVMALLPRWGPDHPDGPVGGGPVYTRGLEGTGDARIEIAVPGYTEPARIVCKSDDPGPESMQGSSCRAVLHDEESAKHGRKTWKECAMRLVDQGGWHLMANTATRGRTWVWHDHVVSPREGEALVWLHTTDNPYLDPREVSKMSSSASEEAMRVRGEFVALEGRVWGSFSRATHVVPAFVVPEGSPRWRAIDFGTRHPFACLWVTRLKHAVDLPDGRRLPDGLLVVYREHYRAEWTLAQHVARMRELEGLTKEWERQAELEVLNGRPTPEDERLPYPEPIEWTWADPEDPQQVLQLVHTYGVTDLSRARKAVAAGITAVAEALALRPDGWPGLVVVEDCVETIREAEAYCWGERGDSERPTGQSDHTCDALRYAVMGIRAFDA